MAYDFDGTDDYMEVGSAPVTAAPLTMACWFNVDNITANHPLIDLTDGTTSNRFGLEASGAVASDPVRAIVTAAGTQRAASSSSAFSATTWHHAGFRVASATNRQAFLDGTGGTAGTISAIPAGLNTLRIGRFSTTYANGRIAEAAIWNTDLTDAEMRSLARGFRPSLIRPSALVFYAPLVREIADYRGGLTVTSSGPVVAEHTRRIA
jgi:hypothetical protein